MTGILHRTLSASLDILPGGAVSAATVISSSIDSADVKVIVKAIQLTSGEWINKSKSPIKVLFVYDKVYESDDGAKKVISVDDVGGYYFNFGKNKVEHIEGYVPIRIFVYPSIH